MFNNQATQHKQSQLLNPFSQDGRASSPKPTFSKDQYGKPLAGSLTEMRGQKANIHVMKEMLELCQIINSEGYDVKDEPTMRVIPFGELFNIYNYISDKVVGILLRARKHKLVDFEGEMLYQRRDDNVPVFLLKPIKEIRAEMEAKIEDIKRAASPVPPQSTSVLLDRSAHEQNLKSRTPSPAVGKSSKAKSASPAPAAKAAATAAPAAATAAPAAAAAAAPAAAPAGAAAVAPAGAAAVAPAVESPPAAEPVPEAQPAPQAEATSAPAAEPTPVQASAPATVPAPVETKPVAPEVPAPQPAPVAVVVSEASPAEKATPAASESGVEEPTASVLPAPAVDDLPTIVIEASAEFVRTISVEQLAPSPETATQSSPDESQPEPTPA
ncbi:skin secretory protein xP2 isoform X2 [Drosophila ficusphila]|nr:skin secretory protein xP2 isoform X2 [Drosophila ficusphila]